jgi:hypothetical protein
MSRFIKISTLLAVMLSISCRELPDHLVGSNTVARVGKKELSISEIKEAMPAGLTGEDSLAFSQLYIDKWLIRQLKIEEADQLFSSSEDDIERLVEEYRQSLLMRKVDQYYIDEQMSEDFSDEDIAEYYNTHKADFTLDRTLVKGRIVRLDDEYRQRTKLKEQMKRASNSQSADKTFTDMCEKNNFPIFDHRTEWINLTDFLAYLPIVRQQDYSELLNTLGVQEMKDNTSRYYFELTSVCSKGNVAPLETVKDNIRRILITQRRSQIIKGHEQKIVSEAFANNHARIYKSPLKQEKTDTLQTSDTMSSNQK